MLRTSRRKERAARRRSQRVQRGGAKTRAQLAAEAAAAALAAGGVMPENQGGAEVVAAAGAGGVMPENQEAAAGEQEDQGGAAAAGGVMPENQEAAAGDQEGQENQGAAGTAAEAAAGNEANAEMKKYLWYESITKERRAEWIAELKGNDELEKSLGLLLKNEDGNHAEAYIKVLAQQDEIFQVAFKLIRKKLDPVVKGTDITKIENLLTYAQDIKAAPQNDLVAYIKDAALFVTLVEDTVDKDNLTKLQEITQGESGNIENVDIFELLLFPDRLQNIFIKGLANLFVMLKEVSNRELLKAPYAKSILFKQYRAYVEALALTQTALPLRDGFFMNQSVPEFNGIMYPQFLPSLMKRLASDTPLDIKDIRCKDLDPSIETTVRTDNTRRELSTVTAIIFKQYADGGFDTGNYYNWLVSLYPDDCEQAYYSNENEKRYYPTGNVLDQKLFDTQITLRTLFKRVSNSTFEYMVHLVHAIKKAEQEAKKTGEADTVEDYAEAETAIPSLA